MANNYDYEISMYGDMPTIKSALQGVDLATPNLLYRGWT